MGMRFGGVCHFLSPIPLYLIPKFTPKRSPNPFSAPGDKNASTVCTGVGLHALASLHKSGSVEHKLANVLGDIPKAQPAVVEPELKAIFYQDGCEKADLVWATFCDKYATIYPSAVECLKRDGRACLAFYTFPATHWKTIRTSNVI
jgi:hypothetical protein